MTRKEAIDKVYGMSGTKEQHEALDFLIPEVRKLRESYERQQEDKRIRKELVEAFEALDIDSSWNGIPVKSILAWLKDQKPVSNPKWTELTWEDINTLERIINNVHYEFQHGIGEESFGKEVLERFREYKDDDSMDEQKPAERAPQGNVVTMLLSDTNTSKSDCTLSGMTNQKPAEIAPNQFDGVTYGMSGHSSEKPVEPNKFIACLKAQLMDAHNSKYLDITDEWVEELANELLKLVPKKDTQQKSAEWSEEDIKKIRSEEYTKGFNDAAFGGKIKEWSEEDEKLFWELTAYVPEEELKRLGVTRNDILKKLKSIRPQPIQIKEAYKEGFQTARHATALAFMNYCDKIRPNGKMCLSSGECEEIEKAFLVGDWEKIERYFHKCHWKPSEEQKYNGIMDKECIKLCDILNFIPSVNTFESCCGHLKDWYSIWFFCNDIITISRLAKCVDHNYSDGKWELLVDSTDTHPTGVFWLRSKVPFQSYDEMEKSVNELCNSIQYWFNTRFDSYFNEGVIGTFFKQDSEEETTKEEEHWKPSEHQMSILKAVKDYVGKGSGYWGEGLGSLIDDLEKLT